MILGVFMLPSEIRAITFFAFNPKRLIVDVIQGKIDTDFELVESIQYIVSKVLDDVNTDMGKTYTEEEIERMLKDGSLTIDM